MQNSNTLWSNVTKTRVSHASLKDGHQTNIAIIGGGLTGLSTALHLLDREQSVTLIEAAEMGLVHQGAIAVKSSQL